MVLFRLLVWEGVKKMKTAKEMFEELGYECEKKKRVGRR